MDAGSLVCLSLLPSSVGDAMCTISAASCFPEPFVSEGRRLSFVHRNFAGTRFSDHVALLSVFQAWDDIRSEVTLVLSSCVCVWWLVGRLVGRWAAAVELLG